MKPETLTFKFHNFRPSDRDLVRSAALGNGGPQLFVAALRIYLGKWAVADWLSDYELERIAIWTALHLPRDVVDAARVLVASELDSSQTEQAQRTYSTFLEALGSDTDQAFTDEADASIAIES